MSLGGKVEENREKKVGSSIAYNINNYTKQR